MEDLELCEIYKTVGFDTLHFCLFWMSFVTSRLALAAIIFIFSKGSRDLILHCLLKVQFVEKDMKMFIPLFLNKVLCYFAGGYCLQLIPSILQ